ncbi:glycosyltransferase family 2 protein [Desulforhopalus vacuolatus]|uniref:glycosyltransferase n=1 Tax=Desulforhopalus vacuolatus TaxID=40414 RepID=UPI001965735F|nr:glycosyltransferase family 2 protein [Desulforhopalus vacuolatus]
MTCYIIIVSHDSEAVLPLCLDSLAACGSEVRCILADSGSADHRFLKTLVERSPFPLQLLFCGDVGFAVANNRAFSELSADIDSNDAVVFLNPDAFVETGTLQAALHALHSVQDVGVVGGRLLGCNRDGELTGRLDSTGIFRRWYGRWYDRGQGEMDVGQYMEDREVPAVCGAFMVCHPAALQDLWKEDSTLFDPSFFLYKEDIELSLRLRARGWKLRYLPQARVLHSRGWAEERSVMPISKRIMAAENEVRLYVRHPSPYIFWALAKYLLVRFGRV